MIAKRKRETIQTDTIRFSSQHRLYLYVCRGIAAGGTCFHCVPYSHRAMWASGAVGLRVCPRYYQWQERNSPNETIDFFLLFLSISLPCLSVAAAGDFYGNTKYPGPKARPDVGLYEVTQPDDADPQKYIPREVAWFPRKGLDFVPLEADMPLRTWTFRSDGPRPAYDQPRQFEAHLIGFRGIWGLPNPFQRRLSAGVSLSRPSMDCIRAFSSDTFSGNFVARFDRSPRSASRS